MNKFTKVCAMGLVLLGVSACGGSKDSKSGEVVDAQCINSLNEGKKFKQGVCAIQNQTKEYISDLWLEATFTIDGEATNLSSISTVTISPENTTMIYPQLDLEKAKEFDENGNLDKVNGVSVKIADPENINDSAFAGIDDEDKNIILEEIKADNQEDSYLSKEPKSSEDDKDKVSAFGFFANGVSAKLIDFKNTQDEVFDKPLNEAEIEITNNSDVEVKISYRNLFVAGYDKGELKAIYEPTSTLDFEGANEENIDGSYLVLKPGESSKFKLEYQYEFPAVEDDSKRVECEKYVVTLDGVLEK